MRSITSHFRQQVSDQVIEAGRATLVAKHNLAFLLSDHATNLFKTMFPDSEIVNKFSCVRTKMPAIVKVSLAPHYTRKVIDSMCAPFSLLMDESSNDKSCIILVRILDPVIGEVCTRCLDMPVVNINFVTANNLFLALKSSLKKHGLSFEKALSFMSDTTNMMRSGVQKLIKSEIPTLYDVGCLADLTGLKALLVDIEQLFQ